MSTPEGNATTVTDSHPRPKRRLRAVIATTALLAAVGATFVWWGNPRMTEGGMIGLGEGITWANDGLTDTRMLISGRHPATVTATFSIRNTGHLPFTVHGLDVDTFAWLSQQQVTFKQVTDGSESATAQKQITLAPEDEATVQWSLTFTCRPSIAEGGYVTIDVLRFDTSWLGLHTTRELPLTRPISITSDSDVPGLPAC